MTDEFEKYRDAEDEQTDEQAQQLLSLIDTLTKSEDMVVDSEAQLKSSKANVRKLKEESIPEQLGSATEWTGLGYKIKITESLHASIKKDCKEQAFTHLESIGHSDIVKRAITVDFGGGTVLTDEMLEAVMPEVQQLVEHKLTLLAREAHTDPETGEVRPITIESAVTKGYSVHGGSLKKLAKELQEEGNYLPADIFNVFPQRVAKVNPTV